MKKIAVTGGLAAGKTSVCQILRNLGAHVISADAIVHRLLSPTSELFDKIVDLLGSDVVVGECVDRAKIAKKVFCNPSLLQKLESLLHPAVRKEIELDYQRVQESNPPLLFVAEIPLLFESSIEDFFDVTIAVIAPETICRARFAATTGYSEEEFTMRSNRQLPSAVKAHKADFTIVNDSTPVALEQTVKSLYKTLVNT